MKKSQLINLSLALLLTTFSAAYCSEQAVGQIKQTRKNISRISIKSLNEENRSPAKNDLLDIINELESLELPSNEPEEDVPAARSPKRQKSGSKQNQQASDAQSAPEPEPETMTEEERKLKEAEEKERILESLTERAETTDNPLGVAESLYMNRNYQYAFVFYKEAMKRDLSGQKRDRAWVIFQTANCLRRDNPDEAHKYYEQLISEFPNSYLANTAIARKEIIDWRKDQQTSLMLEKYYGDPNEI